MKKRRGLFWICLFSLMILFGSSAPGASRTYVYYGNHLDSFNKKVYSATVKTAKKGLGRTKFVLTSTGSGLKSGLASYISNDHPEIYWIGGYQVTSVYSLAERYLVFKPLAPWKNAVKKKTVFNKKVNAVVSSLKKKCKGKNAAQRAKLILDYIAANCSYSYTTYDQTAYGVFMRKKAVCAGYARAYKLLCDRLGVTCICVEGQINGEGHMVNYVKIGKKWYYVDPTWCDVGEKADYSYFLLGKKSSGCTVTYSLGIRVPTLTAKDYPISKVS